MTYTVPNHPSATYAHQARLYSQDLEILAQQTLYGVVSGCGVSAQGTPDMTVAVASGTILVGGDTEVAVTGANVVITAAHATYPRFDLISVNSSGVLAATAGIAAADPLPSALPASSVVLATVYVTAGDTEITSGQIVDKRVLVKGLPGISTEGWSTITKTADTARTSTVTCTDDPDLTFAMTANTKYRIRMWVAIVAGDGGYRADLSGPASPTLVSGVLTTRFASFTHLGTLTPSVVVIAQFGGTDHGTVSYAASGWSLYELIVYNGSNAGSFTLQWAQNSSNAAATTVKAGSYIEYAEVA